jgi:hypothetical protein
MKLRSLPKLKCTPTVLFSIFFCFFLVASLGFFAFGPFLEVSQVRCRVDNQDCPDYIQAELEKNLHHSLFFTRYDQVISHVIERQPSLKNGRISKNIQGEVTFFFTQTRPMYVLKTVQSPLYLVDEKGLVIGVATESDLPTLVVIDPTLIQLNQGIQLPEPMSAQLHAFFVSLHQLSIPFSSLSLSAADQIQISLPDGKLAVVLLDQAPEELLKLQFFLQHQDRLELKEPYRFIDLRFKYPILKT